MKLKVKDQIYEFPEGITPKDIASKLHLTAPEQAVTVSVNGTLRDFNCPLQEGDHVIFWNFDDALGKEVFWHTSAHVLAQAIIRLWPNAKPTIGPPIEAGFYYDFADLVVSDADFEKIEKEVEKIINENLQPQRRVFKDKKEALQHFAQNP